MLPALIHSRFLSTFMGEEEKAREYLRQAVALFAEMGTEPGALEPEIWLLDVW